jgi:hypothetical protein
MRKTIRVILICIVGSLLISSAAAAKRKPARLRVTGIYSNMNYVEEAGDVVGMEVFIVDGGDGYYATVQIAEGAPDPPVLVKVEVKGTAIEFTLPGEAGASLGKFTGTITARGLRGKFANAVRAEYLSRRKSYWQ